MNNNLQFDFLVNKEDKTITVKRAFAAPVEKVWSAWTQSELLDQWWAPKPYKAVTKSMDFREGGSWFYAMTGPEGFAQYCRADYKSIDAEKSFSALDAFCNEKGDVIDEFPRSLWTNTFSSQSENTLVTIVIKYKEQEDLEKIIEMGFREGFTAGLENLDALLKTM
jgi:uncharacterized protein YndB with AHSA1/START domain